MKTKPIGEASPAELRYHAKTVMGLDDIQNYHNTQQLLAKIRAVEPSIEVVQVADQPENPAAQAAVSGAHAAVAGTPVQPAVRRPTAEMSPKEAAQYHYDPKVKVFIPSVRELGGDRHVDVSVNGAVVRIARDQWVEIPYRFYLALKDAVASELTAKNDHEGKLEIQRRDVLSYPYQVDQTTFPSPEALAEWEERVGKVELA